MVKTSNKYPASLEIDYPKKLDRHSTVFRIIWALPVILILALVSGTTFPAFTYEVKQEVSVATFGAAGGLALATALMIAARQRYPKWWFDFALELTRFQMRVNTYLSLMTDNYPSTEDEQSVHLDIKYPDAKKLNRVLPFVKWLLAIPHYIVLIVLGIGAFFAVVIAWFAILFTGMYPRSLFNYVLGVNRWSVRVTAYAFLLVTDEYPPFSLK